MDVNQTYSGDHITILSHNIEILCFTSKTSIMLHVNKSKKNTVPYLFSKTQFIGTTGSCLKQPCKTTLYFLKITISISGAQEIFKLSHRRNLSYFSFNFLPLLQLGSLFSQELILLSLFAQEFLNILGCHQRVSGRHLQVFRVFFFPNSNQHCNTYDLQHKMYHQLKLKTIEGTRSPSNSSCIANPRAKIICDHL